MLKATGIDYMINDVHILKNVSVHVSQGELLGVIGPNGAGKTTLMRVLAGLIQPTKGEVVLEDVPLHTLPDRQRARSIAFVSQNPQAGFGFSVLDIVAMGRYPHKSKFAALRSPDRKAIENAMHAADVVHLGTRKVHELSGGERQRVFIARALAQNPRLLFLDEPTANLDIRYQMDILHLVRQLNEEQGLTVVMAIHDLTWALRFCTHLLVMADGRLITRGPAGTALTATLFKEVFGVEGRVIAEPGAPPRVEFAPLRDVQERGTLLPIYAGIITVRDD